MNANELNIQKAEDMTKIMMAIFKGIKAGMSNEEIISDANAFFGMSMPEASEKWFAQTADKMREFVS